MAELSLLLLIPAYNEERRLPNALEQVRAFVESQTYTSEVLVVENGSQDRTFEVAQAFAQRYPLVSVFQEKQRGKGLAVRHGILKARGEYRFMCDADLSMPVDEINRFLPPALQGFDIVIGSRMMGADSRECEARVLELKFGSDYRAYRARTWW